MGGGYTGGHGFLTYTSSRSRGSAYRSQTDVATAPAARAARTAPCHRSSTAGANSKARYFATIGAPFRATPAGLVPRPGGHAQVASGMYRSPLHAGESTNAL